MKMTDEQRYSAVLRELGEVLQEKNTTISFQAWQNDELKAKLEEVEAERDTAVIELEIATRRLESAQAEIEVLKGGAK